MIGVNLIGIPKYETGTPGGGIVTIPKNNLISEEIDGAKFLTDWFSNTNRQKIYQQNLIDAKQSLLSEYTSGLKSWEDYLNNELDKNDPNYEKDASEIREVIDLNKKTTNELKSDIDLYSKSLLPTINSLKTGITEALTIPRVYLDPDTNKWVEPKGSNNLFKIGTKNLDKTYNSYTANNTWLGAYNLSVDGSNNFITYFKGLPTIKPITIHEITHAANLEAAEKKISEIIPDVEDSYLDDKREIYARLMQLREHYDIDPNKIWTLGEILNFFIDQKKLGKDTNESFGIFYRYTPEQILRLFNEVASVDSQDVNNSNIINSHLHKSLYAKRGNKLRYLYGL